MAGIVEFTYNNKVYSSTRMLFFKANNRQDPRMGFEGRKKGKYERAEKFVMKIKEIQEETKVVLSKAQEKIVTNFIQSYLHQFFNDSHGLKASLKPLKKPFDQCQSCLEAINNGQDIKQINW